MPLISCLSLHKRLSQIHELKHQRLKSRLKLPSGRQDGGAHPGAPLKTMVKNVLPF